MEERGVVLRSGKLVNRPDLKRNLCIVFCLLALLFRGYPQTVTNIGTDFWIAFPRNTSLSATLSIFISSGTATSGLVQSAYPGVNQSFSVVPGIVTQLTVPVGAALMSGIENKGIHITANDPVSVYGLNEQNMSTDAYTALPTNALGMDYRIVNYHTTISEHATALSVVSTQDGTHVSILNHQTGSTINVTLDQGQTYYLRDPITMHDLTGSRIQSDYPVAVYGSDESTLVPDLCSAADHIIEEMFPYYSWGKNFVTAFFAGRDLGGDYFRIVAADNGTVITVNGTQVATINAGVFYETNLAGYNEITASNPVMVAQFAKGSTCAAGIGDPFMMLIPPKDQFLTSYTICNVTLANTTGVQHWVNVLAPDNALGSIYEDGVLIPASAFVQIGTTNYYAAQRTMTGGSHTFNGTIPFGVLVYGWAYAESYGYSGGESLAPIVSIDTITLSPDTAYGQLNITNVCLTANVKDNLNNNVAGALVNFHVGGINPLLGNAYTDLAGNAQYCYTQTGTIPGTDYVYAQVLGIKSDSSVVFWSDGNPCINPTLGGTISGDQSGCGSFSPATLTNIQLPSGATGTLEFKWQQSTTSATIGFADIPGSNSPSYTTGAISQTTWYKRIARVNCKTNWDQAAESNTVEETVNPVLPVSVTISSSANNICAETSVTFTAASANGGNIPAYQWKVNGTAAGANNPVYNYIPQNNDVVTCTLTSSETCTSGNPATSVPVIMIVHPNLPVSVSVTASSNPVCAGTLVTFTAVPSNGGALPGYLWNVNGTAAGTNNPVYTYVPQNNDVITCTLTSSETCTSGNPATAAPVTMTVNTYLPVSVSVTVSANPVCQGLPVNFTAVPVNGGILPVFLWKVNTVPVGSNAPNYSYVPVNGDLVQCTLSSSLNCVTNNPAAGNSITMTVRGNPVVTFSPCFDTITVAGAQPILLRGGLPLGGAYSGNGVSAGYYDPGIAGPGTHTITYTYANVESCAASAISHLHQYTGSAFTCGNFITDIRDGKTYPTVLIGSQCWMASNLDFGLTIDDLVPQTDNCVAEKFNRYSSFNVQYSTFYQWDELMNYTTISGSQGLCPPGWHVPSSDEWNVMLANNNGPGQAGGPMKDLLLVNGFDSYQHGFFYLNNFWSFTAGIYAGSMYWTSTASGSERAIARGLNEYNPSVSKYTSSRGNAFSVRCSKD